ncbi:UNVERIFIED_CONTAM: hypothetical protein FKN15_038215 [Acipenser sinensis]
MSVLQSPTFSSAMTGTPIKITCFITDQSTPNLFWYRQYPQMSPQLMFLSVRADHVDPIRLGYFTASRPNSSHFFLDSTGVAVNDSAVYYCAGNPHSDSNTDLCCVPYRSNLFFKIFQNISFWNLQLWPNILHHALELILLHKVK